MTPAWQRLDIAGKPVDVFEPPNPLPFAVLFLHAASGDLPSLNPAFTRELLSRRLRCLIPHGAQSWWVDRICPEFDPVLTAERFILDRVLPEIASTWQRRIQSVALAGLEMGGQGAVRLAFKHPDQFPAAASIDGAFDFHERYGQGSPLDDLYASKEHCRQDTAILHIPAQNWPRIWFACSPKSPWYRGNDRLDEKLTALGVPHTAHLESERDDQDWFGPMLDFVLQSLQERSRRLMG
jgi:S-formylglutathione hydrolase